MDDIREISAVEGMSESEVSCGLNKLIYFMYLAYKSDSDVRIITDTQHSVCHLFPPLRYFMEKVKKKREDVTRCFKAILLSLILQYCNILTKYRTHPASCSLCSRSFFFRCEADCLHLFSAKFKYEWRYSSISIPTPYAFLVCTGTTLLFLSSGFGGLVVSMLASGIRVRGFEPGRSRWIFRVSE